MSCAKPLRRIAIAVPKGTVEAELDENCVVSWIWQPKKDEAGYEPQGCASSCAFGARKPRSYEGSSSALPAGNLCRDVVAGFALHGSHASQESRLHCRRSPYADTRLGATASIFSVVDAVLVRRLPYRTQAACFTLRGQKQYRFSSQAVHTGKFRWIAKRNRPSLKNLAAIDADAFTTWPERQGRRKDSQPRRDPTSVFDFGVKPALGRVFLPEEDTAGSEHVVLLSYRCVEQIRWRPETCRQTILLVARIFGCGVCLPGFFSPTRRGPLGTNGFYASATR